MQVQCEQRRSEIGAATDFLYIPRAAQHLGLLLFIGRTRQDKKQEEKEKGERRWRWR